MDDKEKILRWNLQEAIKELNSDVGEVPLVSMESSITAKKNNKVISCQKKLDDYLKEIEKKKKPQMLTDSVINFNRLKNSCQEYIDFIDSEEYYDDHNFSYYIFETTVETFFGKKVWDFVNNKHK